MVNFIAVEPWIFLVENSHGHHEDLTMILLGGSGPVNCPSTNSGIPSGYVKIAIENDHL